MKEETIQATSWLQRFIRWRDAHLSNKQFILILSFFIGLLSAVAAYVLHWLIREIQLLLTAGFDYTTFNWLYLIYPVIGIYEKR